MIFLNKGKSMSIRVIKLASGEEVISDITGITKVGEEETLKEKIVLRKPMSLHLIPSEQGIGIQLMPFAIFAKNQDEIPMKTEGIMFCIEPSTDIRNQYADMTGLPLIPDDKIITDVNPNIKLSI